MPSLARAALRAVAGSATAAVGRLSNADLELRTAIPVSRRIGFVSATGGCGTTAALTSVASVLAGRRHGMVLAADAAGGRSGVCVQTGSGQTGSGQTGSGQTGGQDPDRARMDAQRRLSARTAADARHGLARTDGGLHLLDLAEPDRRSVTATGWADQVGPIARFYDLVLTDWGVRSAALDAEALLALNHVLVVVGRADPAGTATAAAFVERLTAVASDDAASAQLLVVLVDVAGGVRVRRPARSALATRLGVSVSTLPHEPARAREVVCDSRRFSAATRTAHIELSATLVGAAARSRTSGLMASGAGPTHPEMHPATHPANQPAEVAS